MTFIAVLNLTKLISIRRRLNRKEAHESRLVKNLSAFRDKSIQITDFNFNASKNIPKIDRSHCFIRDSHTDSLLEELVIINTSKIVKFGKDKISPSSARFNTTISKFVEQN